MQKILQQTQISLIAPDTNLSVLDKWPQVYLHLVVFITDVALC